MSVLPGGRGSIRGKALAVVRPVPRRRHRKRKKEVTNCMFTTPLLSGLFTVAAIVVFIILCYKNVHTGIAAVISAVIAAFGSTNSFAVSIFEVLPAGVSSLVSLMFWIFTFSGILSYLMDRTGASQAVGNKMIKLLGTDRAWLAITITAVILMVAGVGTFMMVVVVVANPLMKSANLPRKVGMIAAQGIAPAINFCMPVPNVPGSLPNMFLGTTLFSAPVLSIATGLVGILLFLFYQLYLVKQARAKGEGYDGDMDVELNIDEENLPGFWASVIPLIAVVVAAILMAAIKFNVGGEKVGFDVVTGINSSNQVAVAQLVGVIVLVILHFSRCKKIGFGAILSQGATSMWGFMMLAGCVYGFGSVIATSAVIAPVQDWVLGLSLNPYITAMVSVAIIAGLCADGISA